MHFSYLPVISFVTGYCGGDKCYNVIKNKRQTFFAVHHPCGNGGGCEKSSLKAKFFGRGGNSPRDVKRRKE